MQPNILFQPITVATSSADADGRLVLVDGRLAAVLVRLQDEMHDDELRGTWFVEAAFGNLSPPDERPTFATLDEAADWISAHRPGDGPRPAFGIGVQIAIAFLGLLQLSVA